MTVNQTRLVRSIQIAAPTISIKLRNVLLLELCTIRATYQENDCGYTLELALTDLWERLKEVQQAEVA